MRRAPDLPADVRRNVEGYLGRILDRQRLRVDLDLGLWYDGNINGAPEADTVAIPAFGNLVFDLEERPVGAWVARTGAKLRWRRPVIEDGRVLVETTASAARNTAVGKSEYNRTRLGLAAGPRIGYPLPFERGARQRVRHRALTALAHLGSSCQVSELLGRFRNLAATRRLVGDGFAGSSAASGHRRGLGAALRVSQSAVPWDRSWPSCIPSRRD